MSRRAIEAVVALALAGAVLGIAGCGAPPALTKAQLDSKKMSRHHPKLTATQKDNCRSCHKEARAVKNQP